MNPKALLLECGSPEATCDELAVELAAFSRRWMRDTTICSFKDFGERRLAPFVGATWGVYMDQLREIGADFMRSKGEENDAAVCSYLHFTLAPWRDAAVDEKVCERIMRKWVEKNFCDAAYQVAAVAHVDAGCPYAHGTSAHGHVVVSPIRVSGELQVESEPCEVRLVGFKEGGADEDEDGCLSAALLTKSLRAVAGKRAAAKPRKDRSGFWELDVPESLIAIQDRERM